MNTLLDPIIGLAPLYLIAMAFILAGLGVIIRRNIFSALFAVLNLFIALIISIYIFLKVSKSGIQLYFFGGYPPPLGIIYEIDILNALLGLLASSLMFLSGLYSLWYMRFPRIYLYYVLLLTLLAGSMGCLYTGDYFNFFVMLEVLSLSSFALVAYFRDSPKSIEAAIRYAFAGIISSSFYLLSAFIAYSSFGTLTIADIALKSRSVEASIPFSGSVFGNVILAATTIIALTAWTWTFEGAIFPNYFWLPDATPEAPTPISAIFVGVIDLIGIYGAIRMFYTIFGRGSIVSQYRECALIAIQILAIVTVFIGSFLMLIQTDVKKFIAFSTISHLGLIFMSLTIDTCEGVSAAILHTISNSFAESLLFYGAGIAIVAMGRSIDTLGVLRKYKIALAGMVIGVLNLLGVPPLIGFWSKYLIFKAFIDVGKVYGAIILALATGISAIGYFKLIFNTFKAIEKSKADERLKNTLLADIVIATCITIIIALGFLYMVNPVIRNYINSIGYEIVERYKSYYEFLIPAS
ncbi:proton-conducting transporter membrane subunit [Ignisphaera sp. 4213-co]|uniref:Proton-conducting transporter membrane subunit n=1 Tax=Ignisphaera cupida TaxID=3050454 RepID=A0ABD4Z647_9CREN|nr:proton-conducting transporter membrane subunit [Ignisphaera sp. 4213-co]MDK6028584.1 proton-conducting transporter membrane subunit [Ignisphaera sp. 4213-co]